MSSDNQALASNDIQEQNLTQPDLPENADDTLAKMQQSELNRCWSKYVWFSGYLTSRSYIPPPKVISPRAIDDSTREELLAQVSYRLPSGHRYYAFDLPQILLPIPRGKYYASLFAYTALASFAFILLLVSACPVPWFSGRNVKVGEINYANTYFTLWWWKGDYIARVYTSDMTYCPLVKQLLQGIAASMVIGAFFTLCSVIAAMFRFTGKGGYGWTLMFGFVGFAWALGGSVMSMKLFHTTQCEQPALSEVTQVNVGFVSAVMSWILLLGGLLILTVVTQLNIGPSLKQIRVMNGYYLMCVLLSLLFVVLANGLTIWKRNFSASNPIEVLVTYWHTEVKTAGNVTRYSRSSYKCNEYNKSMNVSIAFLFVGTCILLFATLYGVYTYVKPQRKIVSCVMSILASLCLCCSWINSVALMYRVSCSKTSSLTLFAPYPGVPTGVENGATKFPGYTLGGGVALVIVASLLLMFASVINMIIH